MSAIMNDEDTGWDVGVINDIFNTRDAELILNIPLLATKRNDKLIWNLEERGNFIVKSRYQSLMNDFSNTNIPSWTQVWKLNIPSKVKVFFWQLCNGYLSTVNKFRHRRIDCQAECKICAESPETIFHVIAGCVNEKECWRQFPGLPNPDNYNDYPEWINVVFKSLKGDNLSFFVMICWNLWLARNGKIWRNHNIPASIIAIRTKSYMQEWKEINKKEALNVADSSINIVRWKKLES